MGIFRKTFFTFILLLTNIVAYGQDIKIAIDDSCNIVSADGKQYVVVEYPGKTAHEIFEGISTNIVKYYNDAKNVANNVQDKAISIRAFSDNLIEFCWWKEPKKLTLGKVAIAYVTAGVSLAVDAMQKGNFYNGDFRIAGFYKLNIEIKDGKAKIELPVMDGTYAVYDLLGMKALDNKTELTFKMAVIANRDKAVATRESKMEKAKIANEKKEKYLKEAISRIENRLNVIMKLPETDW